jgi:hypothetical protein
MMANERLDNEIRIEHNSEEYLEGLQNINTNISNNKISAMFAFKRGNRVSTRFTFKLISLGKNDTHVIRNERKTKNLMIEFLN